MPKQKNVIRWAAVSTIGLAICVAAIAWNVRVARTQLADAKARVYEMVDIGQSLPVVEQRLISQGYILVYEKAIYPTGPKYMQQLVKIGNTDRSVIDTFCYTVGIANPLSPGLPYVVIDASPDGRIIRVW